MELNKSLPDELKLFNFAKKEISFSGLYQISDFPKISEIANNKTENVKVDFSFYLNNNKIFVMKTSVGSAVSCLLLASTAAASFYDLTAIDVDRVSGADRYETALELAKYRAKSSTLQGNAETLHHAEDLPTCAINIRHLILILHIPTKGRN
mgnify:CR=1 FL=1